MSGDHVVRLVVNGESRTLAVAANTTLLGALREQFGLTGAKRGCGTGDCGACIVLVDGEPAAACLTLAVSAEGRAISTVEGLAKGNDLHPLQKSFVKHGALHLDLRLFDLTLDMRNARLQHLHRALAILKL